MAKSRALALSSRIRIWEATSALAMVSRCFCPPEVFSPGRVGCSDPGPVPQIPGLGNLSAFQSSSSVASALPSANFPGSAGEEHRLLGTRPILS